MTLLGELTSRGRALDCDASAFGTLRRSDAWAEADEVLRRRLEEDGYLLLSNLFPRPEVVAVRQEILRRMSDLGVLDPGSLLDDAVPNPAMDLEIREGKGSGSLDEAGAGCLELQQLLYGPTSHAMFERLLGGSVRHFDFTWLRAVAPGFGTVPHADIVYMGRGTARLLTMWVPFSDISLETGGLMILEDSTRPEVQRRLTPYLQRDVDEYHEDRPLPAHVDLEAVTDNKAWNGWLASDPVGLRRNLGGRWLTAEYRMGDALIFPIQGVHGSLDNQCDTFRLSADCRFQLASEPADPRFIGEGPFGHIGRAKRPRRRRL